MRRPSGNICRPSITASCPTRAPRSIRAPCSSSPRGRSIAAQRVDSGWSVTLGGPRRQCSSTFLSITSRIGINFRLNCARNTPLQSGSTSQPRWTITPISIPITKHRWRSCNRGATSNCVMGTGACLRVSFSGRSTSAGTFATSARWAVMCVGSARWTGATTSPVVGGSTRFCPMGDSTNAQIGSLPARACKPTRRKCARSQRIWGLRNSATTWPIHPCLSRPATWGRRKPNSSASLLAKLFHSTASRSRVARTTATVGGNAFTISYVTRPTAIPGSSSTQSARTRSARWLWRKATTKILMMWTRRATITRLMKRAMPQ